MKQIGVAVEGPSDLVFWEKVLNRHFAGKEILFRIRCLNGISRLVREAPNLIDDYKKAGYVAAFFIVDADKSPCVKKVLNQFEESFRNEASKPRAGRFAHLCVAFRELESWILADAHCICEILGTDNYDGLVPEAQPGGKASLVRLCRKHKASFTGMEDRNFAKQVAGCFDPSRAKERSVSFAYFWDRLSQCIIRETEI